jgi:acylglycerol lipase
MAASPIRTGEFTGRDGVRIFFQRRLPGTEALRGIILLVHGLGEHGDRYKYVYQRLVPEGYAFFAPDHRGFGRSGGNRGHVHRFSQYIDDLKQLHAIVEKEFPETPKVIYGHSMGGLITLAYAMAYPDDFSRIIASSPALANPPRAGRLVLAMMKLLSRVYPTFSQNSRGDDAGLSRDPAEIERARKDALIHNRVTARWATEFFKTQRSVSRNPGRITPAAILMLQGTGDTKVIPEATRAFFDRLDVQDKTYRGYAGFYHELHNDLHRDQPLDDIAHWLNQRLPVIG